MSRIDTMLGTLARAVRAHHHELLDELVRVETVRTARTELDWVLAALESSPAKFAPLAGRIPVGNVFVATPVTLPIYGFLLFALGPALVGNHVVARPASASRTSVEMIAALAREVGMELELASGPWSDFIEVAANDADGMVYCGSAEHAQGIDEILPSRVRLVCQGPGVCALVVTATADLAAAAAAALRTRLFNSSQDCLATERVYVADGVVDLFVAELLLQADSLRLGDNASEDTDLGPLLLPSLARPWFDRLADHGAVLRPGGQVSESLYDLAIIEATADAPIVLQETYCPILPIVRYHDDASLMEMLTLGQFALGLTIYGSPPAFGSLDFAHVAINTTLYDFEDAWTPFGGERSTTLLRQGDRRSAGPVLVPLAMSDPE